MQIARAYAQAFAGTSIDREDGEAGSLRIGCGAGGQLAAFNERGKQGASPLGCHQIFMLDLTDRRPTTFERTPEKHAGLANLPVPTNLVFGNLCGGGETLCGK